ncbi:integrase arm-type DNA-binding domain-containing protein [Xinfangfangia sp. D13-10-4-6]|uniref:tyrosine-type recombinase/integrase n=1 Tax=Pseudogemmobacter hezensis TaxID=2737662 RepID=UPI0015535230|nr:site-specific integrase [Pseudogemmobacter hezensis]NPD15776.1 integrase arm-type DNA-binding domain-containing protein [Pseudogemmobacter hezensis]
MKLTAQNVDRLQPTDRRQEIPDDLCTGLYFIVQPTGKKGWQVRYRHGGTHRRMTLGPYPVLLLAEARQRARDALAAASEGRDPSAEVKAAKAPKEADDKNKVRVQIELFEKRHLRGLRSGDEVMRQFQSYIIPVWGEREIQTITKRDVLDLLDGITDQGKATTANRIRAYLSKFFNWCADRDVIEVPPTLSVKAPAKEKVRERVLTDDEIRWLWAACEAELFPWGPFGKMLLLTGQRRNEVAEITDAEIRAGEWHMTAERTKNGRAHVLPLSGAAAAVLEGIDRIADEAGRVRWIFTTTGTTPVSGFSKGRDHLHARMLAAAEKERGEAVDIPHWTWHDLRRTAATGMARLGIPVRVTEAVLNHVSGTGGGIVAVYQRHDYADEKREALEAWARFVAELVEGSPGKSGNVVRLPRHNPLLGHQGQ